LVGYADVDNSHNAHAVLWNTSKHGITVNSIPKVIDAAPGLHTMRDLPLPSFFGGR